MNAIRSTGIALFVVPSMFCWTSSSTAYISMPNEPMAHKVAVADCVVLGKITSIQAKPALGQVWRHSVLPKWEFTIVEVEVQETFYGAKDVKQVRFGLRDIKSYKPVPAVGQTGYFCGVKVGMNDFYVVPLDCFCGQNQPTFAQDVALARRLGRLLARPKEGLKSKNPADRVLTAHVLVLRSMFAPFRYGETGKAEPIDAEESKLAMLALAEADWDKHGREVKEALNWLQWAEKHGAPAPKNLPLNQADKDWPAAARQWLRENAESYRIHRLFKDNRQEDKKGRE